MTNNLQTLRIRYMDILYCFQCLYQNSLITASEKNELVESFKTSLSSENNPEVKKHLSILLQDIFYKPDLPINFKEQVRDILDLL